MLIGKLFLSMEEQTQRQEKKSEESLKKNEPRLLSPVLVFSVLVSILGIFITLSLLVLIKVVSETYNQ